jgi:uncharacterized protein YjbI with pentapeptide repeats
MLDDISAAESVMRKPSSADRTESVLSVRAIVLWAAGLFVVTCGAIVLVLGSAHSTDLGVLSNVTSLLAGTGGVAALLLSARRQRMTELAGRSSEHDATERRVTDLYDKAVDQLGSDKPVVRMAGCFALERLAQDYPGHRQTAVNVLCGLLCTGTGDAADSDVRRAAQSVLTRHLRPGEHANAPAATFWPDIDLDLYESTLVALNLSRCRVRSARFSKATFCDSVVFRGLVVANGISFRDARFTGFADFRRVDFTGGDQSFHGARFDGSVDFGSGSAGVNLSGALTRIDGEKRRIWPQGWQETAMADDACYARLIRAELRSVTEPRTGPGRPIDVSTPG